MPKSVDSEGHPPVHARWIFGGVFLVSMSVLVLQIALTRIFSFTIWYHFAYVTISVALLGYGASGSFLAVFPRIMGSSASARLPLYALACSVSILITLAMCALLPFHPFQIRVEPARQVPLLPLFYLGVTAPFFLAGVCISSALKTYSRQVGRLYFFDLLGAGLGCLIVVFAIDALSTPGAVILAVVLVGLGAVSFSLGGNRARSALLFLCVALIAIAGSFIAPRLQFKPSPEKFLSLISSGSEVRNYSHRWTPIFRTDVIGWADENISRKLSYASWGISKKWAADPANLGPRWRGVTHDGDAGAVIYNFDGDLSKLEMFDHHVLKTPYLLLENPEVLVIGVGGGTDIVNAIKNHAAHVTGVELDDETVRVVREDQADFAGHIYDRPDVTMIVGEGRSTLRSSDKTYDLIQLTGVDTLAALAMGGAYILSESYLYTVEASTEFLDHLNPGGLVSFIIVDHDERLGGFPRHSLRHLSLFIEALRRKGVEDPENHIVVLASQENTAPQVATLVKREPFTADESQKLQDFADRMGFLIWARPGAETDRLHSKYLRAKGEDQSGVLAPFPLTLTATTDDNPFFFNFYKWRYLHRNLEMDLGHTLATGQIVMLLILGMAIITSLVLIVGPLAVFHRKGLQTPGQGGFILFFLGIGLGFIFIEISFIQKFVLFLGYPTYSLTVVLFSLLTFSGIGSYFTSRMKTPPARRLPPLMIGLALVNLLYLVILPEIFQSLLGDPLVLRILVTSALLAPLGLLMGMFFPSGIQIARKVNPDFVPWAWAVNGCGSVVGTILSVILAMSYGFRFVTYMAIAIYLIGVFGMRRAARQVVGVGGGETGEAS